MIDAVKQFLSNLSEEDVNDIRALEVLIQSKGWEVLEKDLTIQRERIIRRLKICKKEDSMRQLVGELDGFDKARVRVYNIIETIKESNENMNGGRNVQRQSGN